jgi:hypothetical protein
MPEVVKKQFTSKGGEWVEVVAGLDQVTTDALYVSVSGGTMTGPLALSGDAVAPLAAVPQRQLDGYIVKPAAASIGGSAIATPVPHATSVYAGLSQEIGSGLVIGNGGVILTLPGWYLAHWNIVMTGGTPTSEQRMMADIDVGTLVKGRSSYGFQEDRSSCSALIYAEAGGTEVVKFMAYQTLGITLNIDTRSKFSVHYLGKDH